MAHGVYRVRDCWRADTRAWACRDVLALPGSDRGDRLGARNRHGYWRERESKSNHGVLGTGHCHRPDRVVLVVHHALRVAVRGVAIVGAGPGVAMGLAVVDGVDRAGRGAIERGHAPCNARGARAPGTVLHGGGGHRAGRGDRMVAAIIAG